MAQISLEEVYRGEKYDVLSTVGEDLLSNGCPQEYDEKTWLEMLLVKHTLIAAEKMKNEGDFVLGITSIKPLSSYEEVESNENTCRIEL